MFAIHASWLQGWRMSETGTIPPQAGLLACVWQVLGRTALMKASASKTLHQSIHTPAR